jgi:hypothetical protein
MNPWVNVFLLIPAFFIIAIILLIRIKGKLENRIYHFRHEGIILQTSLAIYRLREAEGRWTASLGLALLTGKRLVVLDRTQTKAFECTFAAADGKTCELAAIENSRRMLVRCFCRGSGRELLIKVRNPDAWKLEFSRLQSDPASDPASDLSSDRST